MIDIKTTLIVLVLSTGPAVAACELPNYQLPPTNLSIPTFELATDYPSAQSNVDRFVTTTDFRTDWKAYLEEVLAYAFEGNLENDFVVQSNPIRDWFHTPWLHEGHSGREYVHGLTRERSSRPNELQCGVLRYFQNWGIGFYNEAAASQLGSIWGDFCNPSLEALQSVNFPEGSVSFKVLFTEASAAEIDALEGAPTWTAHIHIQGRLCDRDEPCPRDERTVTLLQIDVAVKDSRAVGTGWVFGTFVYDRRLSDPNPWKRLAPISIGWGNNPDAQPGMPLSENIINEDFRDIYFGWKARRHMGWKGRANGPVDNPLSSCISCHGTAQFPRSDTFGNIRPSRLTMSDEEMRRVYFRNVVGGLLFDPDVTPRSPFKRDLVIPVALDYSLQTQLGLEQLCFTWADGRPPFDTVTTKPAICPDRETATERLLGNIREEPVSRDNH